MPLRLKVGRTAPETVDSFIARTLGPNVPPYPGIFSRDFFPIFPPMLCLGFIAALPEASEAKTYGLALSQLLLAQYCRSTRWVRPNRSRHSSRLGTPQR